MLNVVSLSAISVTPTSVVVESDLSPHLFQLIALPLHAVLTNAVKIVLAQTPNINANNLACV
jgi:hypothetical protein